MSVLFPQAHRVLSACRGRPFDLPRTDSQAALTLAVHTHAFKTRSSVSAPSRQDL